MIPALKKVTPDYISWMEMKWNESGFRPPLCTYRLNWARRTSWGWWDDWDDTVLQTQDSKFEPWRSEAEHATSRSRRLPTILTFTHRGGRNIFVSFKPPRPGTEPRTLAWKAVVLTTTLGPPRGWKWNEWGFMPPIVHILDGPYSKRSSYVGLMLAHVVDGGPTINQHWSNVLCLLQTNVQVENTTFLILMNFEGTENIFLQRL